MLTRNYACSEHSIRVEIYMGYDLFKESVLIPIRRRYLVQRLNVNNVEEKEKTVNRLKGADRNIEFKGIKQQQNK